MIVAESFLIESACWTTDPPSFWMRPLIKRFALLACLRNEPAPLFAEWTDDDERTLQALESEVVIEDTELGKERRRLMQDAPAAFALLSEAQRIDLMANYCAVDPAASHSTSATPSNKLAEDNAVETEYSAADNLGDGEEEAVDFINDSEQNKSDNCSEELEEDDKISCISSNEEKAPLMAPSDRRRPTRRLPARFRD